MKSHLVKGNAEAKLYRDHSEFSVDNFKAGLDGKLKSGIVIIMTSLSINTTKDVELKKDGKGKLNNLEDVLKAFESHPSIEKIKRAINTTGKFSFFSFCQDDEVRKFIMNLDGSKAIPVEDIPTDMLKQTIDIRLPIISIDNDCYPDDPKLADVFPFFLKRMT